MKEASKMNEELIQPRMIVDLDAVNKNYEELKRVASGKKICPVVKSNAYGLGAVEVTRSLIEAGCDTFYVSTPLEGAELRKEFPDIQINILNGPSNRSIHTFRVFHLTPVINNLEQLEIWEKGKPFDSNIGCILNLETGFNRLGIKESEWGAITPERLKKNKVSLIMSHLSCAGEDLSDPMVMEQNKRQFVVWKKALDYFKGIPGSLALDAHMINTSNLPISQIRSGAALCGVNVFPQKLNLSPVIQIEAPLLQVETIQPGEAVGYGATFHAQKETKIAILGIGYGHGFPRNLSNKGKVFFSDGKETYEAPLVGRVSMGLINCDVTNIPQEALTSKKASLFDNRPIENNYTINQLCIDAERLDTEIMCCQNSMEIVYTSRRRRQRELEKIQELKKLKDGCYCCR